MVIIFSLVYFQFEEIFEELKDSFKEIITLNHTGVIWRLGEGCKKFATKQASFIQNLMRSLDCFEPEERQNCFILCLSKFQNYDAVQCRLDKNLQKEKLSLHGTLLIQLILEFNKPIKAVNSILNMDTKHLQYLFSNTMGSHIVDSYMTSTFVGEKSRDKLIRKLKVSNLKTLTLLCCLLHYREVIKN